MQETPPTIIYRHRRENLKKCSLRGLEKHPGFQFFTYPKKPLPPLENYIILMVDAPPLTAEDSSSGLLLVDATWRYAECMLKQIFTTHPHLIRRSLPRHIRTAYPRKQDELPHPEWGLASIEALYVAYTILGRDKEHLLDDYYWKQAFLNQEI